LSGHWFCTWKRRPAITLGSLASRSRRRKNASFWLGFLPCAAALGGAFSGIGM
jgi:hypothetical protein